MTASTAHHVLLRGFHALDVPEGFRSELMDGEIMVSPPPVGTHEGNISSVARQVIRNSATEMDFSGHMGLILGGPGAGPRDHLMPDGVFLPVGLLKGAPCWMPCNAVSMVVEVTNATPNRDRRLKWFCYARGGVPLYLLIDRERRTVSLFSEPSGATSMVDYRQDVRVPFGKPIELPEPFAFDLDTTELD